MISPEEQREPLDRAAFAAFARNCITPFAATSDLCGILHADVIDALRRGRWLGASAPREFGGLDLDPLTYGELIAEIGRACSSARTLMTVQGLVAAAVCRWGSIETRQALLPELARGTTVGAFALSEPDAGSDAAAMQMTITRRGGDLVLDGQKSWTSFGQLADVFLVFGRMAEGITAVLVPGDCRNLSRIPVTTMVGTRAAMMAHLRFDSCVVPAAAIVGRPGFGLSHVAATALDHGRYSVAWGAVGIAEAALHASAGFARQRSAFGARLNELPLMRGRLTRIAAMTRAARALCAEAGRLRSAAHASAIAETLFAKYFASKAAVFAANEAVQMHGARGLLEETGIERLLRDAKVTEIIEGSSDLIEQLLGETELETNP